MQRLVICVLLLRALGVLGQDAGSYVHPLSNLAEPLDGVYTSVWFPETKTTTKKFEAGKPAPLVLGIRNGASEAINVSAIGGSINSPFDFSFYVQNFTFMTYDVELQPGQEASFEYTFYPSNQLTPREFIFAFSVFYKTNTYFSNTFFNGTVDVVEPRAWIDSQLLFLVLLAVVGVLVTAYIVYSSLADTEMFKRAKRPRARGTEAKKTEHNPEEWLKGTAHDQFQKAKAAKAAGATKKAA